jgi:iron complex transport system substrate-binding protein
MGETGTPEMFTPLPAAAIAQVAALLLAVLPAHGQAAPSAPFVLRDDLRREVTFARIPQRIVTLLPSLTETVCALDACDRLVATDRYSDWPAQVLALPKAGGLDDAAVELIVSVRADLVLLSRSQRITDRLRQLGIQTFVLDAQTYADIGRNIRTIGRILDAAGRAATLERSLGDAVREIGSESVERLHGRSPSVYFEVDQAPYAAGPQSFIGELLARLGARNIVTPDLGAFPKLNPEYVVRRNPDVIMMASSAQESRLAQRPGWEGIRAVNEHRVCSFPTAVDDTIVRPGPRVPEGMQALARCLSRVAP